MNDKYENPEAQALWEKHLKNKKRIRIVAGVTLVIFATIAAFQYF